MNSYLKSLLVLAVVAGLCAPAVTAAARSPGGLTGEARLHPGTWNRQPVHRTAARSRPMFRSNAPVIVRTEPAPDAVAQAPTEARRSFSYEPSDEIQQQQPVRTYQRRSPARKPTPPEVRLRPGTRRY